MSKFLMKAMQEEHDREIMEALKQLKSFSDQNDTAAFDSFLDARLKELEEQIAQVSMQKTKIYDKKAWDFSKEKDADVFAADGDLMIRPFRQSDRAFYYGIRQQYADNSSSIIYDPKNDYLWQEIQGEQCFYCVVEVGAVPVGYIGIKDTRESLWEVAIELDRQNCGHGYGSKTICLFLKALDEITLHSLFIAKVEADNYASQKCMEKIGATLTGITSVLPLDDDERERFEQEYADHIDDHMRRLAEKLDVDPIKLLSHVLVYEIEV